MAFLVDTGILDVLELGCKGLPQSMQDQDSRWRELLHVSALVWREFERSRRGSALKGVVCGESPPISLLSLPLNSETVRTLNRLRPVTGGDKNAGEDESLALLLTCRPDLNWVSLDYRAVNRGLTELGQARLMAPHELFLILAERGLLSKSELEAVYSAIERKCQTLSFPERLLSRLERL